jgi:hypothetical protein
MIIHGKESTMVDMTGENDKFEDLLKTAGLTHECPQCKGDHHTRGYEELGRQFVKNFLRTQVPYTFYNGVYDEMALVGRSE